MLLLLFPEGNRHSGYYAAYCKAGYRYQDNRLHGECFPRAVLLRGRGGLDRAGLTYIGFHTDCAFVRRLNAVRLGGLLNPGGFIRARSHRGGLLCRRGLFDHRDGNDARIRLTAELRLNIADIVARPGLSRVADENRIFLRVPLVRAYGYNILELAGSCFIP